MNVPEAHKIAVVDWIPAACSRTGAPLMSRIFPWPLARIRESSASSTGFPLACAIEAASGTAKADLPTCDDADDLYFDKKRRRVDLKLRVGRG